MRRVTTADLTFIEDSLVDIHAESAKYSRYEVDHDYTYHKLVMALVNNVIEGYIEPGKGFVLFTCGAPWWSPTVEMSEQLLYVTPKYRGSAVAVKLIREMEKLAKDRGIKTVHVGTSLGIADYAVVSLYQRLGYSISSTGLIKHV
jgi:GNAT superfamily N-acetyltransferase